jgi:hypothetical protein
MQSSTTCPSLFQVWWRKDGEFLPRQSARLRQMTPSAAAGSSSSSGSASGGRRARYSLRIKNVLEQDFGVYECGTNVTGGKQIRQKIQLSGRVRKGLLK